MPFTSIPPSLTRALAARSYSTPTPVQLAVLEARDAGRDLLVSAQTGSGKTVAFGLAMAGTLLGEAATLAPAAAPLALIIAPTRELAMQVQRELAWLYAEAGGRVVTCVGGMDARAEARNLERGAHIVVGTPGRLRDHLERKRLDLAGLKAVVLDEADEMLDLGFREDLEVILDATPANRQTLLFSATLPRAIETLAQRYQRDAHRIETARSGEPHADIEYQAVRVVPGDVENAVVNVLRFHEVRAALVFCATREAVKRMHARLLERGFAAVALSGELTQAERTQALQALRDGRARVLVATDVAARGLDLPDLALVIHADLPGDRETLLHRSGRTGRAGRKGLCVLIVPYNRRRQALALTAGAKVRANWGTPPSAEAIRARDQERFLADPMFTEAPGEDDRSQIQALQAAHSPEAIALALVRLQQSRLPAPEDLTEDLGPPMRREDRTRLNTPTAPSQAEAATAAAWHPMARPPEAERERKPRQERPPHAARDDGRPMVWFRLNIGLNRKAEPRWLLPLICRAGGITKTEVGAIIVLERETRFQVLAAIADQFADTVRTSKEKQGHISRVGAHSEADDAAVAEAIAALAPPSPPPAEPEPKHAEPRPPRETASHPDRKAPWQQRKAKPASSRDARDTDAARGEKSPGSRPFKPFRGKDGKPGKSGASRSDGAKQGFKPKKKRPDAAAAQR